MFACICRGVTEDDVYAAGADGVLAAETLVALLGLNDDTCCGQCLERIDEFVELAHRGVILECVARQPRCAEPRAAVMRS